MQNQSIALINSISLNFITINLNFEKNLNALTSDLMILVFIYDNENKQNIRYISCVRRSNSPKLYLSIFHLIHLRNSLEIASPLRDFVVVKQWSAHLPLEEAEVSISKASGFLTSDFFRSGVIAFSTISPRRGFVQRRGLSMPSVSKEEGFVPKIGVCPVPCVARGATVTLILLQTRRNSRHLEANTSRMSAN